MHEIQIIGQKKYADAVALLTEIGGMCHGLPSASDKEHFLVVSNQQFEELVKQDFIESDTNGINKDGEKALQ